MKEDESRKQREEFGMRYVSCVFDDQRTFHFCDLSSSPRLLHLPSPDRPTTKTTFKILEVLHPMIPDPRKVDSGTRESPVPPDLI
jgi:hypothetical protein